MEGYVRQSGRNYYHARKFGDSPGPITRKTCTIYLSFASPKITIIADVTLRPTLVSDYHMILKDFNERVNHAEEKPQRLIFDDDKWDMECVPKPTTTEC